MAKVVTRTDNVEAMNIAPESVQELLDLLWGAFVWEATREGHNYWSDISRRLEEIRDKGRRL